MTRSWMWRCLPAAALGVGAVVACGDKSSSEFTDGTGNGDGTTAGSSGVTAGTTLGGNPDLGGDGGSATDCVGKTLVVSPASASLSVSRGDGSVSAGFKATLDGNDVAASWSVDRGEVGSIGTADGVFLARGTTGGKATVTATYRGCSVAAVVTVKLVATQNGSTASPDAGGAGGYGGVGGEGPGGAVSGADATALGQAASTDAKLSWLYPYASTIFPRGTLAPLLQWRNELPGDIAAIRIQLDSSTYSFDGTFGRPPPLGSGRFVRHPIPREVWDEAIRSNEGDDLRINVTVLAGGKTLKLPERAVKIAQGPLKGTVYYNSYGTKLAKNYGGALVSEPVPAADGGAPTNVQTASFGAAILAIRGGSEAPTPIVIPGDHGTDDSYCRTCHAVASNGSTLLAQNGAEYKDSWQYALSGAGASSGARTAMQGNFTWPAIFPDGSLVFTNSGPQDGATTTPSRLFQRDATQTDADAGAVGWREVTNAGIPAGLRAAFPAFSKDGKKVVFTFYGGTVNGKTGDKKSLATMDFDAATKTFSNFQILFDGTSLPAERYAAWPSFLPTNDAVVFQLMVKDNSRGGVDWGFTRSKCEDDPDGKQKNGWPHACHDNGSRAEIWYVDLAKKKARALNALNGKLPDGTSYLPTGPRCHGADPADAGADLAPCKETPGDDSTLSFEPTANPVVSGGYAWVVFMSRRMYGNVATLNPWHSDPRFRNLSSDPTPKKLWVAAIKLNPAEDEDPSAPAFYLPAQELLAGNSRGYWVVDPCKSEGEGCASGDECCGGFCRPGTSGALVCTNQKPTCAQEYEACESSSDCCGVATGILCINKRCARTIQ